MAPSFEFINEMMIVETKSVNTAADYSALSVAPKRHLRDSCERERERERETSLVT